MPDLKKIILPGVVFVTGACVLILEVVATRVLSPYFGNTIYTVSSIIGVILAARRSRAENARCTTRKSVVQ